MYTLLHYIF